MSAFAASSLVPPVKWAQRSDSVYLTVALSDIKDEKIELTSTLLTFRGKSEGKEYTLSLEFMYAVLPEESVWKVLPRSLQMHIKKDSAAKEGFWERLLKDKQLERTNIKFDWDKYVDEDEEDDEGFDMSALNGAAKFGGDDSFLDDDDEPDSDDDDLPDLDDPPGDAIGAGGASSTGATTT